MNNHERMTEMDYTIVNAEAHTDRIEVTSSLPKPDKLWVGVDEHGHEHTHATLDDTTEARYGEPYWCEDCHDMHDDFLGYFCRACGDEVEPGMKAASGVREYIPGPTTIAVECVTCDVVNPGDEVPLVVPAPYKLDGTWIGYVHRVDYVGNERRFWMDCRRTA